MAVGYGTAGPMYFQESEAIRYRLSWGSVFAGVVVAMVTFLALELLGLGIGLGLLTPAAERFAAVGIGTGIWLILSTLISLFLGGWVTSWLSGTATPMRGLLHGIVTWGLVTLISFYLMTSAVGALASGFAGFIGTGLTAAPQVVQQQGLPGNVMGDLGRVLRESSRPGADPQQVVASVTTLFARGDAATAEDRNAAVDALVANTTLSRPEAATLVDNWVARFGEFRAQVAATSEQVTGALSAASLWAFFAMILGAGAAGFGGWLGAPVKALPAARAGERPEEPRERKAA